MNSQADAGWAPRALPEQLRDQLRSAGFARPDDAAAECARQIADAVSPAATAALFVNLGSCNFLAGDIDGAVASWRRAIASGQHVPSTRGLLNLGMMFEHLALYDQAIAVLRSAVERQVEPYSTEAAVAQARCEGMQGDNDASMETLGRLTEQLMVNSPDSPLLGRALLVLGTAAVRAGRPDRALIAWQGARSSALAPVRETASDHLVDLYRKLGRHDQAREIIDQSSNAADLVSSQKRLERAGILVSLDRSTEAVEMLATVRGGDLDPADRFRFVELLVEQELINEAIDELESLLDTPLPDHQLRARYWLGDIYRDHGMAKEAEATYLSVSKSGHLYWGPKAALGLGDLCDSRGDVTEAVRYWVGATASPVTEIKRDAQARLTERVSNQPASAQVDVTESQANFDLVNDGIEGQAIVGGIIDAGGSGETAHASGFGHLVGATITDSDSDAEPSEIDEVAQAAAAASNDDAAKDDASVVDTADDADEEATTEAGVDGPENSDDEGDLTEQDRDEDDELEAATTEAGDADGDEHGDADEDAENSDASETSDDESGEDEVAARARLSRLLGGPEETDASVDDIVPTESEVQPLVVPLERFEPTPPADVTGAPLPATIIPLRLSEEATIAPYVPDHLAETPDGTQPQVIALGSEGSFSSATAPAGDQRGSDDPYAALAPDDLDELDDPAPTGKPNPYAELAPNFGMDPTIDSASTDLTWGDDRPSPSAESPSDDDPWPSIGSDDDRQDAADDPSWSPWGDQRDSTPGADSSKPASGAFSREI